MKFTSKNIKYFFSVLLLTSSSSAFSQGIAVIDIKSILESYKQELNQLDQLKQQLTDYKLQLQNLEKLNGNVRDEIQGNVKKQIKNNVYDFGVSDLNTIPQTSSDPGVFYGQADSILKNNVGKTPYTQGTLSGEMSSAGLDTSSDNGMYATGVVDRKKYERVLDDLRQVALTRTNADDRSNQANKITQEMAKLDSNNTVGAIQLLAAQNALTYAQNEDLIKNQAAIIKISQETQARELIENQLSREKEIKRMKKLQQSYSNNQ